MSMTMRKAILASALGALAILAPVLAPVGAAPAAPRQGAAAPSRLLPLQGGQNFRDLGGYRTRDGRHVRWRTLFRSGVMSGLTAPDFAYLDKLGIATVCDFRSSAERKAAPARWPEGQAPHVLADDYALDISNLDFRDAPKWTGDQARGRMRDAYPDLLERFNGQYRRMFAQLLAGKAPLAFNCSAGKDRTGVAAALLLTALDVPRETVIQDYLLSNRFFNPKKAPPQDEAAAKAWQHLPPAVLQAIMGVDRSYIEAVFKVMDAHPGGTPAYMRDKLGLGPAQLRMLRDHYTVR